MLDISGEILSHKFTFLDPERSFIDEFAASTTASKSSKILTTWIETKYYPPQKGSGMALALWTPLPSFPENSCPYVLYIFYIPIGSH